MLLGPLPNHVQHMLLELPVSANVHPVLLLRAAGHCLMFPKLQLFHAPLPPQREICTWRKL
eukprot:6497801-Prorocentrum_lima.AAC.1